MYKINIFLQFCMELEKHLLYFQDFENLLFMSSSYKLSTQRQQYVILLRLFHLQDKYLGYMLKGEMKKHIQNEN